MNISTGTQTPTDTSAQTQQQANEVQPSANSDKVSNAQKTEEKKEDKTQDTKNDFKTVLEEQKGTDKISIEQMQQNNPNQMVDAQYANKFGFDTISSLKNIKSMYNYDTVKISKDDAKFFADLVDNKQFAMQQVVACLIHSIG